MLDGKRRKVYCNELRMTFNSLREAASYIGTTIDTSIGRVCLGKRKYAGTYGINGQTVKLTWSYVESDFIIPEEVVYVLADDVRTETNKKLSDSSKLKKRVHCNELNLTFDSVKEASLYVGMKTHANISKVCNKERNYAGSFMINGKEVKLTWKYVE